MPALSVIGVGGAPYGGGVAQPAASAPLSARYPYLDSDREARIVQDIADLLHDEVPSESTTRKIKRWIQHVLWDAGERRRWWFLEATAARWLNAGDDVIDLLGHAETVAAVWASERLAWAPLSQILEWRLAAQRQGGANAGQPARYALEAGRRFHLWPAPAARTAFAVHYTRPMHVALLPNHWEGIVLDGVLGKYGRHFDRDALTQDPEFFEERYERRLQRAVVATGHFDLERIDRWMEDYATQAGTSLAAMGGSTELLVPASVSGIGYHTIEDGHYPLAVA
jgi:hypothetical protein